MVSFTEWSSVKPYTALFTLKIIIIIKPYLLLTASQTVPLSLTFLCWKQMMTRAQNK